MKPGAARVCMFATAIAASSGLGAGCAAAADYEEIYTFPYNASQTSYASSLVTKNGVLYGITPGGGSTGCAGGCGTLFELTTQGALTTLYSFTSADAAPQGVLSVLGNFYVSGKNFLATISASGALTRLLTPATKAGATFSQLAADGSLLDGAAAIGGSAGSAYPNGAGTVFTLRKSGTVGAYKTLYSFTGGADGGNPNSTPLDVGGTLYGVTQKGGANGTGVFYSVSPTGAESVLFSLTAYNYSPEQVTYGGGKFYVGVGNADGSSTVSVLYRIDTAGNVTVLHNFTNGQGGPQAGVTYVNGTLYGVTNKVVYSLDSSGVFKVLHLVRNSDPHPTSALVPIGGSLYGAAISYGGTAVVYKVTP